MASRTSVEQLDGVVAWWWPSGGTGPGRGRSRCRPSDRSSRPAPGRSRIIGPIARSGFHSSAGLARAGGADDEQVLAAQVAAGTGGRTRLSPTSSRDQVDLGGGVGDAGWRRRRAVNGMRRSTTTASTPGRRRVTATRCAHSASARAGVRSVQDVQVLAADHPHPQGVDRRGDRPHPQHAGDEGLAACGGGRGSARSRRAAGPSGGRGRPSSGASGSGAGGRPTGRRRVGARATTPPAATTARPARHPPGRAEPDHGGGERAGQGEERVAAQPGQQPELAAGRAAASDCWSPPPS